jgi:hypothetical protein
MTALITLSDIKNYKPISSNINTANKLDVYISEAQHMDLRPLLGDPFYYDLLKDFEGSPSLNKYQDLYNGCEYQIGNYTFKHEGLKPILAYLTYSRFIISSNDEPTPFGQVQKTNPYSQPVPDKTLQSKSDQAKSGAFSYWEQTLKYLNHNYKKYPLWLIYFNGYDYDDFYCRRFGHHFGHLRNFKGRSRISSVG